MLEGFRRPDAGVVRVLGRDPWAAPPHHRARVGVVLQSTAHDPYLTVAETLDLARGWYAGSLPRQELLALVGLADQAGRRVATLSGGQQRRLDVALGLVGRPDVLFLDEPTTGFDPVARREAWDAIRRVRDDGVTVVLTTHYLDEAAALADRVLVLTGGRIVDDAPPHSIGGRDRVHNVSFRPTEADLQRLPFGGRLDAGRWSRTAEDVTSAVHELSAWAASLGTELRDLEITTPSLEDAYLELIA
jgi:ABC-2 type transport system ATP-binding protein